VCGRSVTSTLFEIQDKIENEMAIKVTMMINEVDRLGETLDMRNDEVSKWKKKYDELEVKDTRKINELESILTRQKSEIVRLDNAMVQRENRLDELENLVKKQDAKLKDALDENWNIKKECEI